MKLGFIGFGEAAFHISKGLKEEGNVEIYAYDAMAEDSAMGPLISRRAEETSVTLKHSLKELIDISSIIISATSAKYAVSVAENCKKFLTSDKIYVDINAASPSTKEEVDSLVKSKGASFVDAAVMGSIPTYNHKVPILISGNGAAKFFEKVQSYNMELKLVDDKPGSASSIKMSRSIFMKGLTMLLIETLSLSQKLGVEEEVLNSITKTVTTSDFTKLVNNLITRTAVHSERRVAEMDEVIHTLKKQDINPLMSEATKELLRYITDLDLKSQFIHEDPKNYTDVIKLLY